MSALLSPHHVLCSVGVFGPTHLRKPAVKCVHQAVYPVYIILIQQPYSYFDCTASQRDRCASPVGGLTTLTATLSFRACRFMLSGSETTVCAQPPHVETNMQQRTARCSVPQHICMQLPMALSNSRELLADQSRIQAGARIAATIQSQQLRTVQQQLKAPAA
eukprot:GHRR01006804.1.p1 GENE.GHRR01006804.1~~GHRR01006804.1.p1  ORF type:complete len:162 (+),score=16.10 GHRR01006804.1:354-839(+)